MSIETQREGMREVNTIFVRRGVQTIVQDVNAPFQMGDNGQLIFYTANDATVQIFQFIDADTGDVLGILQFYNVGGVVLASLEGASPDASTVGAAQILGGRVNRDKYAYAKVSSDGKFEVNLENGSDLSNSAQRTTLESRTSDTGNPSTVLSVEVETNTGSHVAGFGPRIYLTGNGNIMGALRAGFTGVGATADVTIEAQHEVKFSQGTVVSVTGSRAGNAALASLLSALAGKGLIQDNSTA